MKRRLKSKLTEVDTLLNEFDTLPEKAEGLARVRRAEHQRRRNGHSHTSDIPKRKVERPSGHAEDTDETRLPVIVEHKYYPRTTLEASEMQEILVEDENESPEIGPPPVAHFEEADCIGFDVNRSPRRTSRELIAESERKSLDHVESRRKRRTSSLVLPLDTEPLPGEQRLESNTKPDKPDQSTSFTKIGTKRKLSVSEMEEGTKPSPTEWNEQSERKLSDAISTARPSRFTKTSTRQARENANPEVTSSVKPTLTNRKILAAKTTNSPAKRVTGATGQVKDQKADIDTSTGKRAITRIRARPSVTMLPPPPEVEPRQATELPPKTPAADTLDVFSPISAESSAKPKLPSELAPMVSVEDVLNGSMGRASRRVRSAVSYVEPSLRDKMRRPGKELVGAVEGLAKPIPTTDRDRGTDKTKAIEILRDTDVGGKSEAASPLRDKMSSSTLAATSLSNEDVLKEAVSRLSLLDDHATDPVAENIRSVRNIPRHRASKSINQPRKEGNIEPDTETVDEAASVKSQHQLSSTSSSLYGTQDTLARRRSMMV